MRGLLLAVLMTTADAPFVGLDWQIGALIGAAAMMGDLCSSFVKRRLRMAASSRATGLDYIPEALLALMVCSGPLALTFSDIAVVIAILMIGEVILSHFLFHLRIRDWP